MKDNKKMVNFYDVVRILFCNHESKHFTFQQKMNFYHVDWAILPLAAHENYMATFNSSDPEDMDRMARTADLMSTGEQVSRALHNGMQWELMQDLGRVSVVLPSMLCKGFIQNVRFPTLLSKISGERRAKRHLNELCDAAGTGFYASRCSV